MAVKPIPDNYPRITSMLCVDGGAEAIEFYTQVFGATERCRFDTPDGKIAHAELDLGDSMIMLGDEAPESNALSPKSIGGTPCSNMVYVEDVDETAALASKLGATIEQPLEDKFYGDRSATFLDPFGHRWHISTHTEDVSEEEMGRRMAELGMV